jgi:hypothetical protein
MAVWGMNARGQAVANRTTRHCAEPHPNFQPPPPARSVRSPAGIGRASPEAPRALASRVVTRGAVTPAAGLPASCHSAASKVSDFGTSRRACGLAPRTSQCSPASHPAVPRALTDWVMRARVTSGRAAWRQVSSVVRWVRRCVWQFSVWRSIRWERFQGPIAGFYYRRVTEPVGFWRACGCPPEFRPRLPWWQPFVYAWLHGSGWLRR